MNQISSQALSLFLYVSFFLLSFDQIQIETKLLSFFKEKWRTQFFFFWCFWHFLIHTCVIFAMQTLHLCAHMSTYLQKAFRKMQGFYNNHENHEYSLQLGKEKNLLGFLSSIQILLEKINKITSKSSSSWKIIYPILHQLVCAFGRLIYLH